MVMHTIFPKKIVSNCYLRHYLQIRMDGCQKCHLTFPSFFTDNKSLIGAIQTVYSPHKLRNPNFISQFRTDIQHIKSTYNTLADTLSRNTSTIDICPAINFKAKLN